MLDVSKRNSELIITQKDAIGRKHIHADYLEQSVAIPSHPKSSPSFITGP